MVDSIDPAARSALMAVDLQRNLTHFTQ